MPKDTTCFRCDGTGLLCNACGESEACGCDCEQPEDMEKYDACPDCKGTGK